MKIQINTDKNIEGDENHRAYFTNQLEEELDRYRSRITRVEVHLSDENGIKEGVNDMRCLIVTKVEGMQPIAVSCHADTIELAVSGAIDKLKITLETIHERTSDHTKLGD